jgi:hypothetical protein
MVFSPFVFGTPSSACHVVIGVVDCNELVVSPLCGVQSDELLLVTKVSVLGDCNMLWFPVKAVCLSICTSSHKNYKLLVCCFSTYMFTCITLKDVPAFWLTCAVGIISD